MNVILGAGLSGLICGALNAQSRIYERNPASFVSHRAILRFRDEKISRALGIPFRRVTVRKGIWDGDRGDRPPSPRLANAYSLKVRGVLGDASIWNLAAAERYIAPDDLHSILADICGDRVQWGRVVTAEMLKAWREDYSPVVSTLPLPVLLPLLGFILNTDLPSPLNSLQFNFSPIHVSRYNVPDCDVFQTLYLPDPGTSVYRATLTGSLLTIESTRELTHGELADVCEGFNIEGLAIDLQMLNHRQSFGKIAAVPDGPRKSLLHLLTQKYCIYSLGRFATWRNILLDDVYEDIAHIRRMITASNYDVNLERTKEL